MLSLLNFIRKIRRYHHSLSESAETRKAIQEQKFRELLRYANEHSPYYRKRFAGIDLATCKLTDLPSTNKAEMMANFDDFVTDKRIRRGDVNDFVNNLSNFGQFYLGEYIPCHTSGSQGQPALVLQHKDAMDDLFTMQAARGHAMPKTWGTVFKKMFVEKVRWAMILFKPCFIPSCVAFGYMPTRMKRLSNMKRIDFTAPFEQILKELEEFQPNFITAYLHVLERIAKAQAEGKVKLVETGRLQLLVSISEPVPAESQEFIEKHLKVKVANHYAMGECPGLSLGCPSGNGSHVNDDFAILEVVDENNNPVPDGQPGKKVLLTNLNNMVQPFIRYEIDDVVTLSTEPCPCGNKLPLVKTIAGRKNDSFWYRDAAGQVKPLHNFIFKDAFLQLLDINEYQVMQLAENQYQVLAQPVEGTTITAEQVQSSIDKILKHENIEGDLRIETKLVERIPIDEKSGKLRRFINKVLQPAS